ncbi:uncharacterized protein LOC110943257 [Helianthus annuus]|uniref:uncharacterized protein LOC110943257 n=1 Tax=Helianthus annuus TaxID=4232 RepID=UPI000B9068D7|nr:uncharacterized protein LOC110943257 [Helianthus annuus]
MPFQEGALPVRYLGVPLISSKLSYKDCKVLVEKMEKKIDNWTTKSLSFAARIVTDLEKRMRDFLWSGNYHKTVKPKVAWKVVCLPKDEGGLGIRSLSAVNKALLSSHVRSILSNRNSLWVRWIHTYKLKGRSFWEIPSRGRMTWGWRKLLASRSLIRPLMWKSIGNGADTNAWSDTWCNIGPLRAFITPRRIANAGFSLQSSLAELVSHDGQWNWPTAWDSRDHLFFECSFALQVWNKVRSFTNMEDINGGWSDIMAWMNHNSSLQKPDNVISRLVVAAATYFIWQERNSRLFSRNHRTAMVVSHEIITTVRLRLLSLKFKRRFENGSLVDKWKIPDNNLELNPG